jgi:hypothetical protein
MSLGGSITKSAIALKHRLPIRFRASRVYWDTARLIHEQERWTEDHIAAYQIEKLRQILRHFACAVYRVVLSRSSG